LISMLFGISYSLIMLNCYRGLIDFNGNLNSIGSDQQVLMFRLNLIVAKTLGYSFAIGMT